MGVRGLTTFINNNKSKYMVKYELHDTTLIIDGNNIACQLYKWHCKRNDCFGGDYDKYAKVVYHFFALLRDCNVTPIVVFDGGYENKKMRTVYNRLKKKVRSARYITSVSQKKLMIFPILMNNLFTQIVVKLNYQIVRTDFEADYEMACLAQNLNCPILSYDSDFFIFDVIYLPFSTFHMEKFKLNKTQYYIRCEVYTIDSFIGAYPGLSRTTLPLMATLLGNDYINKRSFKQFYDEMKIPKARHLKSFQQQTIITLLKWMQNETFSSAVNKIVNRMKKKHTKRVLSQIKLITRGYICRKSILLSILDIEVDDDVGTEVDLDVEGEDEDNEDDDESSEDGAENPESDNEDAKSDDEDLESSEDEDPKSEEEEEDPRSDEEDSKSEEEDSKSEEEDSRSEDEDSKSDNQDPKSANEDPKQCENNENNCEIEKLPIKKNRRRKKPKKTPKPTTRKLTIEDLPSWFLQNFRKCKYPSNFMDILTRNKYFCNPQVENYATATSYRISANILAAINKILTSANLDKLTYVSRYRRRGLRNYRTPPCKLDLPKLSEIDNLNREELKNVFLTVLGIHRDEIGILEELPESWHLYILSIMYWIKNSKPKVTNTQLYSLFLCMLVLSVIDPQVGFFRSTIKFNNKLDATLKTLSKTKVSNVILPEGANFKKLLDDVTYNHCILALKELIAYFQMKSVMANRSEAFDTKILHPFAEFQTCLLHIQYLNMLLNEPFENFLISDFYDGTFIYYMTENLMKRFDLDSYLNVLLGQSPSILLCCKFLFNEFLKLSSEDITKTIGKKRRKKNKNKEKVPVLSFVDENEMRKSDNEEEIIVDVNNKFSLLNLLK